ncbi:ABC transporter permease [Crassaminicella profunda]|uniref:ABC transporter permease n=1 Tax=Crassaminicella profunda TaxID=1286698 RepID=UPI001CA69C02|nr:ABC transporter permease subunit [Crassaminicella profunda]QZY53865.1 ABC transporter permease subunit [Crassaminicella profunda]
MRKILENRQCFTGTVILTIIIILGIAFPVISGNDPFLILSSDKFATKSFKYLLGADQFGRCILTRIAIGTKYSLGVSFIIIGVISVISLTIGTIPTYCGGKVDRIFVGICDVFMAFPQMVFIFVLIGIMGKGICNLMISMVIAQWAWYAKVVRGYVLEEKNKKYIKAAIASGSGSLQIILFHIIPNIFPAFIVYVSLGMGRIILELSAYSFLGLGVSPSVPEWGAMLNESRKYIFSQPQLMIYPGLFIFFTSIGFNLLGDGIRDVLDKKRGGIHAATQN